MSVINLGRTFKQSIAFYQTDGMGRDCYITYNNGGFWKSNHIRLKSLSNSLHSNTKADNCPPQGLWNV